MLVRADKIASVGPLADIKAPADAKVIDLPGTTLMPGLIEAHSHVLLHPYNETSWNDQNAHETLALRIARATVHLHDTLMAGFTTIRDLETEGAGYADVGLKQAVEQGIIPGPRMLVVTRAIVATGSYGPKGYPAEWNVPQGAEEADGSNIIHVVRDQIGRGADWIKVYADYRWGPRGETEPTFSLDELKMAVDTARSSGRAVAAHVATAEGMRRAILAGVETVEHGDNGTAEVFQLMKEHNVLVFSDAVYRAGVRSFARKKAVFKLALDSHVTIGSGSDVGVFPHGDNAREIELLANFRHALSTHCAPQLPSMPASFTWMIGSGQVKAGLLADLIAVDGNRRRTSPGFSSSEVCDEGRRCVQTVNGSRRHWRRLGRL